MAERNTLTTLDAILTRQKIHSSIKQIGYNIRELQKRP